MDWLDRISIWVIVLLIIGSLALIAGHLGEARSERNLQQRGTAAESSPGNSEIDNKVKLARNLMDSGNPGKAEALVQELIQKYPYDGQLHMVMGDILMRRQDPVKAILEYKEAIDLNPDYLDKKTPLFQGKKLKTAVGEAVVEIEKKMKRNPADESVKADRKVIYYLQRKIAGSCG